MKNIHLKTLSFISVALLSIPILWIVYKLLFPIIYIYAMYITKDEHAVFFYGYWIAEALVLIIMPKYLLKLFKERKAIFSYITTAVSAIVFVVFAVNVFPHYSKFPDNTVEDLVKGYDAKIAEALKNSTNHNANPNYNSERARIEKALKAFYDTTVNGGEVGHNIIYELFGTEAKDLKQIYIDTILYSVNYDKVFLIAIYVSREGEYSGHGFVGYHSPDKGGIRLFYYRNTLFPYNPDRQALLRQLYFEYFVNVSGTWPGYGYSALDGDFWIGSLFPTNSKGEVRYAHEKVENI